MNLYGIPPLLSLLCFMSLGFLTLKKSPPSKQNRIFMVLCLLGTLLNADILLIFLVSSKSWALWISRVDHVFLVYTIPLYIHFFHEYLSIPGRKTLIRFAYGYAFFLMCLAPTPLCLASMQRFWFGHFARGGLLYPLVGGGAMFAVGYSLFLIYRAIRMEKQSAIQRNRLRYMLVGFGGMGLLNAFNLLPLMGFAVYPAGAFSFIPLTLFAFGLFRYDLLDLNILIRSSIVHAAMALSLTISYGAAFVLTSRLFPEEGGRYPLGFLSFFFLLVVVTFRPAQSAIRSFLENRLRTRSNAVQETLQALGKGIASVLDLDEIVRLLGDTVRTSLEPEKFSSVLRCSGKKEFCGYPPETLALAIAPFETNFKTSPLGRHFQKHAKPLERRRLMGGWPEATKSALLDCMDRLQAEVIFPLHFRRQLNGFLAIGESRNGRLYTPEDLMLMETLASQTALAVANANAYQRIDMMNAGLEKAVRKRTRELEAALEEKEHAQATLIRSESLAAIGQLVAGAAHELNNPLASAISLLQSALETVAENSAQQAFDAETIDDLVFARSELCRARDIVSSLLDLSRQTQAYNEPVDLSVVAGHALRIVKTQFKTSRVQVVEEYETGLPTFHGNFANIGQAIVNLIKNAFQALAESGGTIFLVTRWDSTRRCALLTCRDTGPGIPRKIAKDLFKPFFTTKPVGQGTGLGLYVSHEIIKKHGGQITVRSDPGKGFAITMEIPLGGSCVSGETITR